MEIDSPAQSLKKLLEEKAKTQPRGPGYSKRAREITQIIPKCGVRIPTPSKNQILVGF